MMRPSLTLTVVVCVLGGGVVACQSESSAEHSSTSHDSAGQRNLTRRDLSARCGRALGETAPAPIRRLHGSAAPPWGSAGTRFGADGPPLGSVNGVAWRGSDSALYVLDGLLRQVRVYGGDGTYRFSFGGEGRGPGEFDDVHGGELNPDRIAVTDGGTVAVRGRRFVHLFRHDGRFISRLEQKTGRTYGEVERRLFLRLVVPRRGDTRVGFPDGALRDPNPSESPVSVAGVLLDAPVVPLDEERKKLILGEKKERYGPRAPMIGTPWDEFYQHWPETLPRYIDIVLRRDSTAWLQRVTEQTSLNTSDAESQTAVDVVHPRRGYIGSYESTRFPVAFKGRCALFTETQIPADKPSEAAADSAFHGLVERCPKQSVP